MENNMISLSEFLFDYPLYTKVYGEDAVKIFSELKGSSFNKLDIEGYNPVEKCDTTYSLYYGLGCYHDYEIMNDSYSISYRLHKVSLYDVHEVILRCKRYGTLFHFLIRLDEMDDSKIISKVGQYPSVADIHIGQVHKYDAVLKKEKMREFTKAIGLAANGVGIGSFVYLRRVFEFLVFEAVERAQKDDGDFNKELFDKSKMNEKIKMLAGYLPEFLVENYKIYGILSKGVHELSEDECKEYFTVLRESIEMILDEKLERFKKEKRKKEIRAALNTITKKLTEE